MCCGNSEQFSYFLSDFSESAFKVSGAVKTQTVGTVTGCYWASCYVIGEIDAYS